MHVEEMKRVLDDLQDMVCDCCPVSTALWNALCRHTGYCQATDQIVLAQYLNHALEKMNIFEDYSLYIGNDKARLQEVVEAAKKLMDE